ncbi:MAG: hypothetical protein EOP24_19365 [Hyphomicrobiales bacterium]|nr:MAG: hypothetical protein EOP24_19365 [Hyphomicrobiales bacterium]
MNEFSVARIETLRPVSEHERAPLPDTSPDGGSSSWWGRYTHSIANFPSDTREVIEADATYIVKHAMPQINGALDEGAFGASRVRTGLVIGSVQSGKTASMLAVGALLLDQGVDILIVLAGTRVSLWLQTYERLLEQLDGSNIYTAWKRSAARALVPQPEDVLAAADRVDPSKYLLGARNKVRSALAGGKPAIFVVPKEDDHLLALGRFLDAHVPAVLSADASKAMRMVVLDDEADDSSVLDAMDGRKITPKFIQHLWSNNQSVPATRHERLFVTYVAYTATPQANYLQHTHNPLAPRDFHAALRVPSDRGSKSSRSVTYVEADGLRSYYTGGDFYYERFRGLSADPCMAYAFPEANGAEQLGDSAPGEDYEAVRWRMIGDALRSYFVAGAIRLILSGRAFPASDAQPVARHTLLAAMPPVHSMLYHPSALKDDQFAGAADIVRWSRSMDRQGPALVFDAYSSLDDGLHLDVDGLIARLSKEEPLWQLWLDSFQRAGAGLSALPGHASTPLQSVNWQEVKTVLETTIFVNVKVRVLNSDPRATDRPQFSPVRQTTEEFLPPRDLLTIFVAGNVLSRGLTIEGLCTSLFMRSAKEPAADTQMQMQRWFGYRGPHFEFCRVFAFSDQLKLFRQYHTNDQAMKSEILAHMCDFAGQSSRDVLVLQGEAFKATSKVDSKRVPLSPGPTPSVRLIEPPDGSAYRANLQVLQSLLERPDVQYLEHPEGTQRGLIGAKPLEMLELAGLLESLRYSSHDPDPELELSKRWASLQRILNWPEPLFRPPGLTPLPMAVDPSSCPYSIAAYLRLWDAALARPSTPGLMPTDNPSMPWNMINVASYRATVPRFYFGVRFGAERQSTDLKFKGQSFPLMRRGQAAGRNNLLETLWGSRNPSERWLGDQMFDYHFHNMSGVPRLLSEGAWRPRGHPGLVLFHVVADPQTGQDTVAVGLSIPRGGPDHVAALRDQSDD